MHRPPQQPVPPVPATGPRPGRVPAGPRYLRSSVPLTPRTAAPEDAPVRLTALP
jgi:hypothetical protein